MQTFVSTADRMVAISDDDLARLRAQVRGAVLVHGDDRFDDFRRIWNGTVDRRPAAIARCRDAGDVRAALLFALDRELRFSVCGGGHNVAGTAVVDGGLMIDLREMRDVDVDPRARVVRVAGGATMADIDNATLPHGIAVPVGVVGATGVAGLTLGGGIGWLRRKHGLTCDNLLSATVVTASGDVVRASATEHPDLFWALRGGGGNFGIVVEFEFQAYPVRPDLHFCLVFHPLESARAGLRLFHELAASAPDDMNAFAIFWSVPDADPFPVEHRGKPTLVFAAAWLGDPAEGERYLAPLRTFSAPYADLSEAMPFAQVQALFDEDYPDGARYYWKSNYIAGLDDAAIDELVQLTLDRPSPESTIDIWQLGGAIRRVPATATAYPHRGAPYLLGIEANWHDPRDDAVNRDWARRVHERMRPFGFDGAVYVNFPGDVSEGDDEGDDQVRRAYGANYERLQRVKATYDPQNRFSLNQNIRPRPADRY